MNEGLIAAKKIAEDNLKSITDVKIPHNIRLIFEQILELEKIKEQISGLPR